MNTASREGRISITLPGFRRLAFDLRLEPPAMLAIGIALAGADFILEIQIHLRTFLWNRPERIPPVLVAAIDEAFAFVRADYRHFAIVFTILARTTAAGLVAALIFEPPTSALADPAFADLTEFINWGYWVVLAVAGLSTWRPSFLFPAGLYLVAHVSRPITWPDTGQTTPISGTCPKWPNFLASLRAAFRCCAFSQSETARQST